MRVYEEGMSCMKEIFDKLDLHGLTIDEAIPLVDMFLYKSYQARMHRVWVIHGKGSGVLRNAVRRYLAKHKLVRTCLTADKRCGGNGATQVELIN